MQAPRPHDQSPEGWHSGPPTPPRSAPASMTPQPEHPAHRQQDTGDFAPPAATRDLTPPWPHRHRVLGALGIEIDEGSPVEPSSKSQQTSPAEATDIPQRDSPQNPLSIEHDNKIIVPAITREEKNQIIVDAETLPTVFLLSTEDTESALRLRAAGSVATSVLLEQTREIGVEAEPMIYGLARSATEQDASQIAAYIAEAGVHRTVPLLLFQAVLERIADSSVLPDLQRYVENASTHPDVAYRRIMQVLPVVKAARERASDPVEIEALTKSVEAWESTLPPSYPRIVHKDPERAALDHAQLFFYDDRPQGPNGLKHKLLSPPERVAQIEDIYTALAARHPEMPEPHTLQAIEERTLHREASVPPHTVTIGAEIEIEENHAMRPNSTDTPDARANRFFTLLEDFDVTRQAGLPAGGDELWEFAFNPARHSTTLTCEAHVLRTAGLINPEVTEHPMHITISGVSTEGPEGEQAFILIRSLEATGWSTSGDRLLRPVEGGAPYWATEDRVGGIRERKSSDMAGPASRGVELSTFTYRGLANSARTFNSVQALGSALAAHQHIARRLPATSTQQNLATIWQSYAKEVSALFEAQRFDDPLYPWVAYFNDDQAAAALDVNFLKLAKLLKEAELYPKSEGAVFQDKIQRIIIKHRANIWRTLYGQRDRR